VYIRIFHPNDRSVINPFLSIFGYWWAMQHVARIGIATISPRRSTTTLGGQTVQTTDKQAPTLKNTVIGHTCVIGQVQQRSDLCLNWKGASTSQMSHGFVKKMAGQKLDPAAFETTQATPIPTRSMTARTYFPTAFPHLNVEVRCNLKELRGSLGDAVVKNVTNWRLSSGDTSGAGAHADFMLS
jgi:hypothetical protein